MQTFPENEENMKEQHQIDKIFKERLESHTTSPSPEAWAQVKGQIQKKTPYTRYLVAATVALFLISSLVWVVLSGEKQENLTADNSFIDVNYPKKPSQDIASIVLPRRENLVSSVEIRTEKKKPKRKKVIKKANPIVFPKVKKRTMYADNFNAVKEQIAKVDSSVFIPKMKKIVVAQEVKQKKLESITNEVFEEKEQRKKYAKIKITYIASSKSVKQETEKSKKTKAIWKKLGDASPMQLLADIRTVKERLIQGEFSNRQE